MFKSVRCRERAQLDETKYSVGSSIVETPTSKTQLGRHTYREELQ